MRETPFGYIIVDGILNMRDCLALAAAWSEVVIVGIDAGAHEGSAMHCPPAPNRLHGSYINEDGDAV